MAIALKTGKHTSARVASRTRRQIRGRKKVSGTTERPRLVVTRSSKHITVQVVDDLVGKTLASASTMEADIRSSEGDKASSSPSARSPRVSPRSSSTGPATSTTVASRPSRTAPARAA
jgi:large subunit ribosomal protein L18